MKFKQVTDLLTTLEPELFTKEFIKHPKPLPLKIHLRLIDKYSSLFKKSKTESRKVVCNLLWIFTNRPQYLKSVMFSNYRVNIQGVEDESTPIELEHKINAKERLEEFNELKYWKLVQKGEFSKVLKDLVTKKHNTLDLEKVFVAASVQLANLKSQEDVTEEKISDLIDRQAKKITNRLFRKKGISFNAILPLDQNFIKLLTLWYAVYKDIFAIQVNGKVYKCEAFYNPQANTQENLKPTEIFFPDSKNFKDLFDFN